MLFPMNRGMKMYWIRKAQCLILAMLLLALSACSFSSSVSQQEDDELQERTKLDWYINYSWFTNQWGGDRVTQTISEETGIDVEFVVPQGSEKEKLDALISQGNLPDLITLWWGEPQVQTLIDNGYVLALNELAEMYCPDFFEVAGPEQLEWYTEEDGNIYCYPGSSVAPEDYETGIGIPSNQTFLVRKDMYEALGSPDMTTPEGFCDAVRRAAEMFPEVDGYPMIPIGTHEFNETGCYSFGEYLMNFLAIPFEKDGKIYDRMTDPEYIRWLKVFRELQQEGYLVRDVFLDKRSQMTEKISRGQYFCMLYQYSDMTTAQRSLWDQNPDMAYMAVDGPKNSNGDAPVLSGIGIDGWTVTLISKNCKAPEKAIELMTYMISEEGQKLTLLGKEGMDYTWHGGQAVLTDSTRKLFLHDYAQYVQTVGGDNTYWMLQDSVMQSQWHREYDEAVDQMRKWTTRYSAYTSQYNTRMAYDSEEFQINTDVQYLWAQVLPELLMADSDEEFDQLFADFVRQRDEMGYDKVLAEQTRQMIENKKKLGIS